jgi:hypothetical protein
MINHTDIERIIATQRTIKVLKDLTELMEEDLANEGGLTKAKWKEVRKSLKYIGRAALINRWIHSLK